MHEVDPDPELNLPLGHGVQVPAPSELLNCPDEHGVQVLVV